MPKEIEKDDGTMETVYSEEEVKGFKDGAAKNKERKESLAGLAKEMEVGEGESIENKLKELKENANPNFAKYRKKFNALEKIAKEKGVKVDDDGEIVEGNKQLTADEIKKVTKDTVKDTLAGTAREQALSQYTDKKDRDLVEHYLDKLMATDGTLSENLELAEAKAFPGRNISDVKNANNNLGGRAPVNVGDKATSFSDTEEGKAMLENMKPAGLKQKEAAAKK